MNKTILYLRLLWWVFVGNLMKLKVWFQVLFLKRIPLSENVAQGLIVSLTSYGARVSNNSVCYTLHSILTQSTRPERIILWLDKDEFDNKTIPYLLKQLKKYGIDVCYCENIRSFKKIIPTIRLYPDADIITVDDDIYYSSSLVKEMLNQHQTYPHQIIALGARIPKLTKDGKFLPYKHWTIHHHIHDSFTYYPMLPMPVGAYGVYYPAHVFDDEALKMDVALNLCPRADDLWLYIMGLRRKVCKRICPNSKVCYYQVDLLRQHFLHDRLYATNVGEDQNDVQLNNLLKYYNIKVEELIQQETI